MSLSGKQVLIKHDGLPLSTLLLLIISAVPHLRFYLTIPYRLMIYFISAYTVSLYVNLADCSRDQINIAI